MKSISEKKKIGVIYKITNLIDGKVYIGQTTNFDDRMRRHRLAKTQWKSYLYRAIKKHGSSNFSVEKLYESENYTNELLNELEMEYIKQFSSKMPNGYNLTEGGGGIRGHRFKMKPISAEERQRRNLAISKMNTGRKKTEEAKKKISERLLGNTYTLGYKHTDATKEKMSKIHLGNKSRTGMKDSPETRLKKSIARQGSKNPAFGKPSANRGKKMSEETRRKKEVVRPCKYGCGYEGTAFQVWSHAVHCPNKHKQSE